MNIFIKILITIIITAFAIYPYLALENQSGIFDELKRYGLFTSVIVITAFFTAVGFYCKSLRKTLTLIKPENRKMAPRSVWLMFLIPYNFFEDFFIVANIAQSLEQESKTNDQLRDMKDFGLVTGLSWATAQIISLYPDVVGQIAGAIGILLWIKHWLFIAKVNRILAKIK